MTIPSLVFALRYGANFLDEPEAERGDPISMEPENSRISIIDTADGAYPSTIAFTYEGIQNLQELIEIHRQQYLDATSNGCLQ